MKLVTMITHYVNGTDSIYFQGLPRAMYGEDDYIAVDFGVPIRAQWSADTLEQAIENDNIAYFDIPQSIAWSVLTSFNATYDEPELSE